MNYCLWCHEEMIQKIHWENVLAIRKSAELCEDCTNCMEKINGNRCSSCSRAMKEAGKCFDCKRWDTFYNGDDPLTANYSLYKYNERMREVIAKWKYRGDYCLREIFREEFKVAVQQYIKQEKIKPLFIPIPLSVIRLQERGFNQAEALAELVGEPLNHVMERVHSEKQSKMGRLDRMQTMNPFKVGTLITQPVILMDDIYTTGRTLRHAAMLLRAAGAPKVVAFTLIRG